MTRQVHRGKMFIIIKAIESCTIFYSRLDPFDCKHSVVIVLLFKTVIFCKSILCIFTSVWIYLCGRRVLLRIDTFFFLSIIFSPLASNKSIVFVVGICHCQIFPLVSKSAVKKWNKNKQSLLPSFPSDCYKQILVPVSLWQMKRACHILHF